METADRQLFDYFYKILMIGGKCNGDNTLYLDNNTTVTSTLYFQEDTFLTLEVTARDTDFCTFGQIQLIRLEIHEMIIVSTGYSNKALHLAVGDNNFLTATGIRNVLQIAYL